MGSKCGPSCIKGGGNYETGKTVAVRLHFYWHRPAPATQKGGRGWWGSIPEGGEAPTRPARSPLTGISTSTVQGRFPGPKCYLEEGVPKNLAGFLKKGEGGYAIIDDWKQWAQEFSRTLGGSGKRRAGRKVRRHSRAEREAQGIGGRAKNRTGLSGPEKGIGA